MRRMTFLNCRLPPCPSCGLSRILALCFLNYLDLWATFLLCSIFLEGTLVLLQPGSCVLDGRVVLLIALFVA